MFIYILLNNYRQENQNAKAQKYREADSTAATLASEDDIVSERLSEIDECPPPKKLAWTEQEDRG